MASQPFREGKGHLLSGLRRYHHLKLTLVFIEQRCTLASGEFFLSFCMYTILMAFFFFNPIGVDAVVKHEGVFWYLREHIFDVVKITHAAKNHEPADNEPANGGGR